MSRFYQRVETQYGCNCIIRNKKYLGTIVNFSYDGMCVQLGLPADVALKEEDQVTVEYPVEIKGIPEMELRCAITVKNVVLAENGAVRIGGVINNIREYTGRKTA